MKKTHALLVAALLVLTALIGVYAGVHAVSVTAAEDVPAPAFLYDFSAGLTEQIVSPNGLVQVSYQNKEGYVTFTAEGDDPYFRFNDGHEPTVKTGQLAYAVIQYRTTAAIAAGEFFTNRRSGPQWGGPGTHVTWSYISDGAWHAAIADASEVWGNNPDDSLYAFRLDPLASGAKPGDTIDIAFIAFFATEADAIAYAVHALPEDADNIVPRPMHKVEFLVDGKVIYTREFREGDTEPENVPVVPIRPGYTGVWESYELGTADLRVNAVYTPISTETVPPMPDTEPVTAPITESTAPPATEPITPPEATEPVGEPPAASDTEPVSAGGCASSLALSTGALLTAACVLCRRRSRRGV